MRVIKALFICAIFALYIHAQDTYREFHSGKEAIAWWDRLYKGLILSEDEKAIIYKYTFGDFFLINDKLRSGATLSSLSQSQQEMVQKLDKALQKTIIFENIQTYRYEKISFLTRLIRADFFFGTIYKNGRFIDGAAQRYLATLIGKHYEDYGFMSTTLLKNSVFQTRPVELIIRVPKLVDAMFVSMPGLVGSPDQHELLFPRNRILKIESFTLSSDMKKVSLVVTMQGVCIDKQPCEQPIIDNLNKPDDNDDKK